MFMSARRRASNDALTPLSKLLLPPAEPTVAQLALAAVKAKREGSPDAGMAAARFYVGLEEATGGIDFAVLKLLGRTGLLP